MSNNVVWLRGNVVADAEVRTTSTGKNVGTIRVATTEDSGASKSSEFHNVVAWEELADKAAVHAKKGTRVFVTGRLATRSYEDKTGTKRYVTEVVARTIEYGTLDAEEFADSIINF